MWKIENWEEDVRNTEVTELDTLREHTEYINVVVIKDNIVYSSSGDVNILVHEYPNERAEKVPEEWREPGRAPPKRQPTPQREVGRVEKVLRNIEKMMIRLRKKILKKKKSQIPNI